ncbi:hypothetical protein B0H19DRAFT_1274055 [Mycena capillaripes]|nr:hypothetical protein B0H19DRAFT_1274055 [Mycena capillaripes]
MTVFWIALFATPLVFKINSAHAWRLHLNFGADSEFDDSGSACNTICAPIGAAIFSGTVNDTYCTDSFVQQYAQCLDCGDKLNADTDPDDAQDSQGTIDTFVQDCTVDGHAVHSTTVIGSFEASAGGGSAATQSQAPSTPPTASNLSVSGQGKNQMAVVVQSD